MKQFKLTEEIKKELSKREWMQLFIWATSKRYYDVIDKYISIGQMIQFLDEHVKDDWGIHFGKNLAFVAFARKDGLYGKTLDQKDKELIDGLWEAVKEVLGK